GGGAKANIMLAMQSLADPEAAMGKDGTQRVLDNLNTRIWFRLTDDATAKLAVEGLGMTSVSREEISHSLSFGGGSATSAGSRGALQYVDRPLIRPEWMTGLPRGEAFARTRGENWKLRVPLLEPVGREELEKVAGRYGLTKVLAELKGEAEAREGGTESEEDMGSGRRSPSAGGGSSAAGKEDDSRESGSATGTDGESQERATAESAGDSADEFGAALGTNDVEEEERKDAMVG
ncbi:MAG: TraM recognition domain-containing protein, partial [Candidatus Tectomicrobia bacterium]|nr:TraM recognition domain-containing protein [Candidatus Tectomicrobia bacterium]